MCWCLEVSTRGKVLVSVLSAMCSQSSLLGGTTGRVITVVYSVRLLLHGTVYGPWALKTTELERETVSADDIDFSEGNCI